MWQKPLFLDPLVKKMGPKKPHFLDTREMNTSPATNNSTQLGLSLATHTDLPTRIVEYLERHAPRQTYQRNIAL